MSGPSAAIFHETAGGNVNLEGNELINSAQNTTVNKSYYYFNIGVFKVPDIIGHIAKPLVALIRMNQSTGAEGREHDPVEIRNLMTQDPSPLPAVSIADRYTRSMLGYLLGYPLYEPAPFSELSTEYVRNGVNVGDVGFVREDGAFDFLFNICPTQNGLINPSNLPNGLCLLEHSKTRKTRSIPPETCLFSPTVTKTESGEYICKGSDGAVLVLPEGAIQEETINIGRFEELAKLRGVEWYEYTKTLGRSISNGSLYLVTSFSKCNQWGITVFDRPCDPGQGLTFVSCPLGWKGLSAFLPRVAEPNQGDISNQCVFLRGYKIMIRPDIFDKIPTRQRAQRIRGGGGTGFTSKIKNILTGKSPLTRTTESTVKKLDKVLLLANFNSSPVHPSDLINGELLSQNPDAKVALTHDDVWCDLLRDNITKLNYATLVDIARSYASMIDEYGCVSLERMPEPSNVLNESDHLSQIREARESRSDTLIIQATLDCPSREVKDEDNHGILIPIQAPFIPSEHSSIDHEGGDGQSRETGDGDDPGFLISKISDGNVLYESNPQYRGTETPALQKTIQQERNLAIHSSTFKTVHPDSNPEQPFDTSQQDPADSGPVSNTWSGSFLRGIERHIPRMDAPSVSFFHGASNFTISNLSDLNHHEVRGNTTIIGFGDGQFTEAQRNDICDYIASLNVLPDINNNLKKHVLALPIISLPRAMAMFDDYQTKKKSGLCFKGTRVALLREMADWATGPDESRMYILSGLAGIGKSTIAYTIASRAADLNLLGASFFFSRGEADRNNAKKFFTTIAYQLCIYNETFSKAIGDVLLTERGSAATMKDPQDQLQALILYPLRSIVQSHSRPILIVVDALDECDEDGERAVVKGLSQLVWELPSFKVILTTRPQPHLDRFLRSWGGYKIFHLRDIEDKVVDGDIWLYLQYNLSLEQVQRRYPMQQWCASDEEIDSLVRAVGRLFIIASTAVRYIFDKSASNPAAQMQKLLLAFAQDYIPFKDLNDFYTVILQNIVPENCDDDIVSHYQSVVGAIISVQRPLSVSTLAHLIDVDVEKIHAVLDNLQSVILLDSDDVPRVYHESFPNFITDRARCKGPCLQIDTRIRHTQIAIRCFEIMDKYLKRNILGLGYPARFMCNEDGLKEDRITEEQLQEKIPQQLCYACVYWFNHLEVANIEDEALVNGLERFAYEHMLYWLEVLSLIGKLDSAYHAIDVVMKLLMLTSSDLRQLLSDALRFIGKFYELIKRSALHTYYSALPFAPTDSILYHRYIKDAAHNMCTVEGGAEKWDALVANLSHGERVDVVKFSLNNAMFVSCSQGKLKIWDAATGTPISMIPGHTLAVANDFSTVASSEDKSITFYNVNGSANGTVITTLSRIQKLALSSESSRVAAALSDGTVWLWESRNAELIDCFDGFESLKLLQFQYLQFSPTGTRLAYSSASSIKLRDAISGGFIADLQCGSHVKFEFSGDGSRIASVSSNASLTLWNSESGEVIVTVEEDVGQEGLAISTTGSLLATYRARNEVKLWSDNGNCLAQFTVFGNPSLLVVMPHKMTFLLDNILAIATFSSIELYNVKTSSCIHTLSLGGLTRELAFSPDCTRLADGDSAGNVNLWDIQDIDASGPPSKEETPTVTALALSRDCSRLACGFGDGTVGISPTKQRIGSLALHLTMEKNFSRILPQSRHTKSVQALGFDPNGKLFASGSGDGIIKLWNGGDESLHATLKAPSGLQAVALSNSVLVAAGNGGVTLWSLDTLRLIHAFQEPGDKVSIAENSALIAVSRDRSVSMLDVVHYTTTATFDVPYTIDTMAFLPNNSQLVAQSREGVFLSFDTSNKHVIEGPMFEHLIQLANTSLWHGVPVWHCEEKEQHYFSALFFQSKIPIPVLWVPRHVSVTAWTQGSSIIALGCEDGRIILLRPSTSHVS